MSDELVPLTASDAILAEETDSHIDKYLKAGGSLAEVSETLQESYEGIPEMIKLMAEWCDVFSEGHTYMENCLETVLKTVAPTVIPRLDDALLLPENKTVIQELVSSPRWGSVVDDLARRHKKTVFYNIIARQKRLEAAKVPEGIYASLDAFMNELVSLVQSCCAPGKLVSNRELQDLYDRLSIMCSYDEVVAIVCIRLFSELARDAEHPPMVGVYHRLCYEIRKGAVKTMVESGIAEKETALQYIIRQTMSAEFASSGVSMRKPVISALLGLLEGGTRRRYDKEIMVLRDIYGRLIGDIGFSEDDGEVVENVTELDYDVREKALLVTVLCSHEVLDGLLNSIFSHAHRTYLDGEIDVGKKRCLCLLMSYTTLFRSMNHEDIEHKLGNEDTKRVLRMSLNSTMKKLGRVATVCEELKPGGSRFKVKTRALETLLDSVKDPVIARGILVWAKEGLNGGADLRALVVTAPKHLAFLEALAENHAVLRTEILSIIRDAYLREYSGLDIMQIDDLREMFIVTITGMFRFQMGPLILAVFEETWADDETVDKEHLRRFIMRLLQTVSPPYDKVFVHRMLCLLEHERVKSAVSRGKVTSLVEEFKSQVTGVAVS